jgi:hypothetical protein
MADTSWLRVGPQSLAEGNQAQPRGAKTGETCVSQVHGKYYEGSSHGDAYSATVAAAGVAPGTALGTTAAFTLYNPRGSRFRLAVQRVVASYISGTLGAGTLFYVTNTDPTAAAPTGGTKLTPQNLDLGRANNAQAIAFTGATLPSVPVELRPFCSVTAFSASTGVAPFQVEEDVDGEIVVEPGCALSLEGVTAAGTSPLISIGMTWREVPIV